MNQKTIFSHYKTLLLATVGWFFLDFATKAWVKSDAFQPWVFIEDFLYFTAQKNSGIAFGISVNQGLLIVISFLLIVTLIWVGLFMGGPDRKKWFLNQLLFGIILGGAIGNLVDRILEGAVIDFIVLKPIPTFNIADIGITVGLILLLISSSHTEGRKM